MQVCQGEVERLDGIITHFLKAIRPQKLELNELDLLGLVEDVLRVQEAELSNRKLEVKVEVNDDLPIILGDRDQIKQAFFNLIKNAMEAMQPSGSLRILARCDDDYVYLQFVDNGSGISEEDLSKVFQAYYTTKEGGHGLGMMIVERIMREHGGHINIESRKEAGTAITLQFPSNIVEQGYSSKLEPYSSLRCKGIDLNRHILSVLILPSLKRLTLFS